MKRESSANVELDLLLEDYGKRPSQRVGDSAIAGRHPTPPAPASRGTDDSEEVDFHLLLEDYPSRAQRWLTRFSLLWEGRSDNRPAALPAPANDSPELSLLLEDYDPRSRFLASLQSPVLGEGADREKAAERAAGWQGGADAASGPWRAPGAGPPPELPKGAPQTGQRALELGATEAELQSPVPAKPAMGEEAEPDLLVAWEDDTSHARQRQAGAGSLAIHAVWIVILIFQPHLVPPRSAELEDPKERETITLIAPSPDELAQLTQKDPNEGPLTAEFRGLPEPPRPLLVLPETVAPEPQASAGEPKAEPQPEELEKAPEPPEPEPPGPEDAEPELSMPAAQSPKPDEFRQGSELAQLRVPNELPAPRRPAAPSGQPKLTLEDPKATMPGRQGALQLGSLKLNARPDKVIEGAIEKLSKGGGGRQAVGDQSGTGGLGGYLPPSPGNIGSNLELLSDPKGVDFRPYLIQVLAAVRRNWYAVIPESARLGITRGRVAIQFAIRRDGMVPKLVIASSSRVQSLDRAAVAGISASHPFPPLPNDYFGSEIRLQFVFLYNMKTR